MTGNCKSKLAGAKLHTALLSSVTQSSPGHQVEKSVPEVVGVEVSSTCDSRAAGGIHIILQANKL